MSGFAIWSARARDRALILRSLRECGAMRSSRRADRAAEVAGIGDPDRASRAFRSVNNEQRRACQG